MGTGRVCVFAPVPFLRFGQAQGTKDRVAKNRPRIGKRQTHKAARKRGDEMRGVHHTRIRFAPAFTYYQYISPCAPHTQEGRVNIYCRRSKAHAHRVFTDISYTLFFARFHFI